MITSELLEASMITKSLVKRGRDTITGSFLSFNASFFSSLFLTFDSCIRTSSILANIN